MIDDEAHLIVDVLFAPLGRYVRRQMLCELHCVVAVLVLVAPTALVMSLAAFLARRLQEDRKKRGQCGPPHVG